MFEWLFMIKYLVLYIRIEWKLVYMGFNFSDYHKFKEFKQYSNVNLWIVNEVLMSLIYYWIWMEDYGHDLEVLDGNQKEKRMVQDLYMIENN